MSQLKKELEEALNALETQTRGEITDEMKKMTKKGKINRKLKDNFKIKGWCFDGDHPIIDIEGGE